MTDESSWDHCFCKAFDEKCSALQMQLLLAGWGLSCDEKIISNNNEFSINNRENLRWETSCILITLLIENRIKTFRNKKKLNLSLDRR